MRHYPVISRSRSRHKHDADNCVCSKGRNGKIKQLEESRRPIPGSNHFCNSMNSNPCRLEGSLAPSCWSLLVFDVVIELHARRKKTVNANVSLFSGRKTWKVIKNLSDKFMSLREEDGNFGRSIYSLHRREKVLLYEYMQKLSFFVMRCETS